MPSVLVIEKAPILRDLYRQVLEREGYEVREAADGAHGVWAYLEAPPDVVLCDLGMPDKDGLRVIRELRILNPAVKVVAVSGVGFCADGNDLQTARQLGAVATLAKPFGVEALLAALRQALFAPPYASSSPPALRR